AGRRRRAGLGTAAARGGREPGQWLPARAPDGRPLAGPVGRVRRLCLAVVLGDLPAALRVVGGLRPAAQPAAPAGPAGPPAPAAVAPAAVARVPAVGGRADSG